jgi:hypothetical protein
VAATLKLEAGAAAAAGLVIRRVLAVESGGKGAGKGLFADPHGPFEEQGMAQPLLCHGALQQVLGLVLPDDLGKRKDDVFLGLFHRRIIKAPVERRKVKGREEPK